MKIQDTEDMKKKNVIMALKAIPQEGFQKIVSNSDSNVGPSA
jgi:hypothetical protein